MDHMHMIELALVKVCRICLSDEGEMKPMYSTENEEDPIWKKYEQVSNIEVNKLDITSYFIFTITF